MNLIDWMMEQTRTEATEAPAIVSENHDVGSIDWLRGLSDPGEMIACGYMPQARRRQGEQDAEYAARLKRELTADQWNELAARCRPAALKRASLDTRTGRVAVMVAGAPPWHGLGVNVKDAVSSYDAAKLASLNWTVSKRELSYQHQGEWKAQAKSFAIVRDDTGDILGAVGSRYEPIQNAEGFAFLDTVLAEYGAKYRSAGAIFGGEKVWMQADMPKSRFTVAQGDEVEAYCLFSNPHDGSGKAYVYPTSERVVCANTLRVSTRDQGKGIGIRHTGDIKAKIADAQRALGLAAEGFDAFKDQAQALARVRVPSMANYANAVLDEILPVTGAQAAAGAVALARSRVKRDIAPEDFENFVRKANKDIEQRSAEWDDIMERFSMERCQVNGIAGTAWAALQAVTEHADYCDERRKIGSPEARASRRFESVLAGDRDELKQVALNQALAFIR